MRYYGSQPEDSWARNNNENNQPKNLNKSQKAAVAVLAFFAFIVIIFWGISFKNSLTRPFSGGNDTSVETQNIASQPENNSEEALRNKDTDKDGLSDWDELYFYNTSPYLEDSDSDGYRDKEEIDNGEDPNCPFGRDCYTSGLVNSDKEVSPESADSGEFLGDALGDFNSLTGASGAGQAIDTGALDSLDAAAIRQLLLENGMDKAVLDQISDEDLVNGFREVLNSQ